MREASPFSLAEYVQMANMGLHTLIIEIETEHASGSVTMCGGEVWSAYYGRQRGEQAFYTMVNVEESAIQVHRWHVPTGPRELLPGCQELLIRAAVRKDEARHLAELVSEGLRAVIAGQYYRAAALLTQARAIDPCNVRILHQLKRLTAMPATAQPAVLQRPDHRTDQARTPPKSTTGGKTPGTTFGPARMLPPHRR